MGSFLSIDSEQGREEEEDKYITSVINCVRILKFEDTLADENYRQFKIIYDSLLLEGKVVNLTKSMLEVVLVQKPPAWLQVIYERLKHLIISSETFRNKKKGYMVREKVKLAKKNSCWGNKGPRRLQVGNLSNHWPKDNPTKNSIIGTMNN